MKNTKCANCGQEMFPESSKCPNCGHPNKRANYVTGWKIPLYLGIGFFVIWLIGINASNTAPSAPDPKQTALANLELKKLSFSTGGFGTVMLLNVTIQNNGAANVKDVGIECGLYSNSGTKIDSASKVVYEVIPAGKSLKLREFNMGFINSQATNTRCGIRDVVVM